MPLHSMMRCFGAFIFSSLCTVAADAFEETASGATRHASGASAAANSWRLFMISSPA
jgi:hypothetical protein